MCLLPLGEATVPQQMFPHPAVVEAAGLRNLRAATRLSVSLPPSNDICSSIVSRSPFCDGFACVTSPRPHNSPVSQALLLTQVDSKETGSEKEIAGPGHTAVHSGAGSNPRRPGSRAHSWSRCACARSILVTSSHASPGLGVSGPRTGSPGWCTQAAGCPHSPFSLRYVTVNLSTGGMSSPWFLSLMLKKGEERATVFAWAWGRSRQPWGSGPATRL